MKERLLVRKPLSQLVADSENTEHKLKKTLSSLNLVALGVGGIIGAGIFVLTGSAAANHAGPSLVISFIISAIGCVFAGLCYAEFSTMIPIAGSAYTYAYATLGEFVAWIIGWDLILEYLFAASTVAVGWSEYMVSFLKNFNIIIPDALCSAPLVIDKATGEWVHTGAILNFPAVFIIIVLTTLLCIGIRESARFNNIIVLIKVVVVLLFIGFGFSFIDTANLDPFIPENTGKFGEFGWSGILTGAGVIFFAYIGFDAVSTAAQEAKNPKKSMPIGILVSLLVCTLLYILVALTLTGIVNYKELKNVAAPIAYAIDKTGLYWLQPLIKVGAIAGLSSVILIMLMGQPRIFFSMANDGLLPKSFAKVHPKFRTPFVTTIVTGGVAAVIAGLFPISILGELVSIGTLFAFTIVCIGIIVLRRTMPDAPRSFRTPFVPLFPALGAIICMAQMASLPLDTWMRLIIWMAIGLAIYFTYGIKRSKMNRV